MGGKSVKIKTKARSRTTSTMSNPSVQQGVELFAKHPSEVTTWTGIRGLTKLCTIVLTRLIHVA